MAETIWGPEFEQYATRNFDLRLSEISDNDIKSFHDTHQIPPLAAVENSLCRFDPKVANYSEMGMGTILEAIRKYSLEKNGCK
ncbi:hypothetical protein FRC10_007225, partial [Ceratobasidium sp. 414]